MSRVSVSAVRKKKNPGYITERPKSSPGTPVSSTLCVCVVCMFMNEVRLTQGEKKCVLVNLCKSVLTSTLVLLIKSSIKYRFNWNSPSLGVVERERADMGWCYSRTTWSDAGSQPNPSTSCRRSINVHSSRLVKTTYTANESYRSTPWVPSTLNCQYSCPGTIYTHWRQMVHVPSSYSSVVEKLGWTVYPYNKPNRW